MSASPDSGSALSGRLSLKVIVPVVIGMAVVAWLFYDDFNPDVVRSLVFDWRTILCLIAAWIFAAGRDFGLTWRFRSMTDRDLRWGQSLRVCMLCEFTSAITPSAAGGSAFGMLFLHREGIALGRATTLMMATLFLDELFFVISCPLIFVAVPSHSLFGFNDGIFSIGLRTVFWLIYGVVFLWTALLFAGVIAWPEAIRKALTALSRLKMMRRWADRIRNLADTMVTTGRELRTRGIRWWSEAFAATAVSWTSRYLVVNMLFLAFAPAASQLVVFGRQIVVWLVLMVSPTPGGSGVSEWLFTEYYGDLIGAAGLALVIALFWRVISYYVYLVIGACIVPGWLRRGFSKSNKMPLKKS